MGSHLFHRRIGGLPLPCHQVVWAEKNDTCFGQPDSRYEGFLISCRWSIKDRNQCVKNAYDKVHMTLKDFSHRLRRGPHHGSSIAELTAAAMSLPEARVQKVQALRDLMEAGQYQVSAEQLAAAMLDQMREAPTSADLTGLDSA
jgi:hypothetical protein